MADTAADLLSPTAPPSGVAQTLRFSYTFCSVPSPPLSRPLPHCYDFDTYEDEGGGKSSSKVGKLERWEVGKMGSCKVAKLGSWEAGKLGCCKVGKLDSCEAEKLGCCNVGKLESCKAGRLGCWEGGRLKVCLSCLI